METSVAAIVVLYNPDLSTLDRLLSSLSGQVSAIYAIDNTPVVSEQVQILLSTKHGVSRHISLGSNLGVAAAQNNGIKLACAQGHSHVLLLDQDSVLPACSVNNLVRAESNLIDRDHRVAAVGPMFIDEKTEEASTAPRQRLFWTSSVKIAQHSDQPIECDYLISSGSLVRLSVFAAVGPLLDELFIDWVDIEWCLRAKHFGYRSYVVPEVVMKQSVGQHVLRLFGRNIYIHGPVRGYYRIRNIFLLVRKPYLSFGWKLGALFRVPKYIFLFSYASIHPMRDFFLFSRACIDGIKGVTGKYSES